MPLPIAHPFSLTRMSICCMQIAYGAIPLAALALNSIMDRLRRRRAGSVPAHSQ